MIKRDNIKYDSNKLLKISGNINLAIIIFMKHRIFHNLSRGYRDSWSDVAKWDAALMLSKRIRLIDYAIAPFLVELLRSILQYFAHLTTLL